MGFFTGKIVWITGASSGIGEALAHAWVQAGATVILSARRVDVLEQVRQKIGGAEGQVHIVPLDLSDAAALPAIADTWTARLGRIDILVNNGGISQRALATDTLLETDRRIMEVNYFGQVALTKAVLPHMLRQGGGHLVAISSITGKFGFPLRSAYAASKHALHGFFETLLLELADRNIRVTVINPGRIKTDISLHALQGDGKPQQEMDPGQEKGMPADVCARQILRAVEHNRPEANIGGAELIMVYLKRYIPSLFRFLAGRVSAR
ncbi:MAG: SDR family oxidoreductase [Bacteroidia bacterium]|nr:SDR family oxidoreductase [Bacteroidia bacterium]